MDKKEIVIMWAEFVVVSYMLIVTEIRFVVSQSNPFLEPTGVNSLNYKT